MKEQHANKCRLNINMGLTSDMQPAKCDCDGYHTFDELYNHRITLFIRLCYHMHDLYALENPGKYKIWKSVRHSDGSSWDGWFIMGIGIKEGEQITYHLPMTKWAETDFVEQLDKAPEFDGHTSDDVLVRLAVLWKQK